jgi:hypothetical protein
VQRKQKSLINEASDGVKTDRRREKMKKSPQEIVRRTRGRDTGQDVIEGSDYQDSLVFGVGVSSSDLVASRSADGLLLSYGASGDSVLIRGDSYPDVLHFADGTTIATSQLFTVRWRTRAAVISNSKAANDDPAYAWRDAA